MTAFGAGGHRGPTGFGNQVQALHRAGNAGCQGVSTTAGIGQGHDVATQRGGQPCASRVERIAQLDSQRAEGGAGGHHRHPVGDAGDVERVARAGLSSEPRDINGAIGRGLAGYQRHVGCQIGRAIVLLDGDDIARQGGSVGAVRMDSIAERRDHLGDGVIGAIRCDREGCSVADLERIAGTAEPYPTGGVDAGCSW